MKDRHIILSLTLINFALMVAFLLLRDCHGGGQGQGGASSPPDTVRMVDTVYLRDTVRTVAYTPAPTRIIIDTVRDTAVCVYERFPVGGYTKVYYHDTYRDSNITIHIHDTVAHNRIASRRLEYEWIAPYRIVEKEEITKYVAPPNRLRPSAGAWGLSNGAFGLEVGLEYGRYRMGVIGGYGGQWVVGGRVGVRF